MYDLLSYYKSAMTDTRDTKRVQNLVRRYYCGPLARLSLVGLIACEYATLRTLILNAFRFILPYKADVRE